MVCYEHALHTWSEERRRLWADLGGIFEVTGSAAGVVTGWEEMWRGGDVEGWATEDGKGVDGDVKWEDEKSWE